MAFATKSIGRWLITLPRPNIDRKRLYVGQVVLVDYYHQATKYGERCDVKGGTLITLPDLKQVMKLQGTNIHPCGILVFPTDRLKWY